MKKNNEHKKITIHTILPFILLPLILIFLIVSITKFAVWNKGIELASPIENATFSPMDDSEDYFVFYTPEEFGQMHRDYVDDGKFNIVIFGDESMQDYSDQTGIAQLMASKMKDATIYNLSFPGSQITPKYNPFELNYKNDIISLYWLSLCVAGDNYDFQKTFWDEIEIVDDTATTSFETLQSIDFSTIDLCIFNYNAKEYLNGQKIESIDREDFSMYSNAIYHSIEMLEESYPHMQFIVASPTYCLIEKNDTYLGSEITNSGYGFLPTYMIAAKNVTTQIGVSFMDNILGAPINKDTYSDYLSEDGITLNKLGRAIIANRYIQLLNPSGDSPK